MNTKRLIDLYGIQGKTAIITGAASGIGRKMAELFSDAGARIVVADLNLNGAETTAACINSAGGQAIAVQVDTSDEASVTRMIETATEQLGAIDILVNNAAIFPFLSFLDTTTEQWDRMHAVNTRGVFLCMRETIRSMRKTGKGGAIVNISSISSVQPVISDNTAYGSSKAGVNAITRNTAYEFASDGIRVNAVLPGGVATEGAAAAVHGKALSGPITNPERKLLGQGQPDDIAHAALFLASSAARFITGQLLTVDGGFQVS